MAVSTLGPEIFSALALVIRSGKALMTRRDPNDKEFFVQDWIESVLRGTYTMERQGRISHPDYLVSVSAIAEGLEIKSLEARVGRRDPAVAPCRSDVDFNSAVPCGKVRLKGKVLRCYYAFVLYEKVAPDPLQLRAIALAFLDGNFLNRDFGLSEAHKNVSSSGFGSYGDAFIRTRKMYRFPNPLTFPAFRYRTVFVTEDKLPRPKDFKLKAVAPVSKRGTDGKNYPFQVYELA